MESSVTRAYDTAKTDYLDKIRATFGDYKQRSVAFADPKSGHAILEVGCGTGDDVAILASIVGPRGRVVGVDLDERMIAEAKARVGALPNVEFRVADVVALPYPDASFDRARADRVFQHLPDPRAALREMIRVTRVGGLIALIDTDWGTLTIDSDDPATTRRILDHACDSQTAGWMGRRLYRLCVQEGLANVDVVAATLISTDWPVANRVWGLTDAADKAAQDGVLPRSETERWLRGLTDKAQAGCFFAAISGFAARGARTQPA